MGSIVLDKVCVDFPIYDTDRSLRKLLFGLGRGGTLRILRHQVSVRALDSVSIEFHEGDRVGLIGRNGVGKSTLLRVMAGSYHPSSGKIEVKGDLASVLTLGVGLDIDDTGYENIYTGCLFHGMPPAEIKRKMPEIAEFTELGDFLHVPVRTYSAGMHVRLAFAIATALDPDILLLDEVIGAGDAEFMIKAQRRVERMMQRASLLVLASHSTDMIRRFCNKVVLLNAGRVEAFGDVESTIAMYEQRISA